MERETAPLAGTPASNALDASAGAERALGPVLHCEQVSDLALLYEPEILLVTAAKPPGSEAAQHAAALAGAGERISTAEVVCIDGEPRPGSLDVLTLTQADGALAWADYVAEITGAFALLVGARLVGVRQVVADGPHCPRFHVDRVAVRGVLTVLGPGTQWLPNSELDRSRLGHAGGEDDATSGLVKRWDRVQQLEAGSLALFKGTKWPDIGDLAVVHRSPPATGTRRVVLTLDWLD